MKRRAKSSRPAARGSAMEQARRIGSPAEHGDESGYSLIEVLAAAALLLGVLLAIMGMFVYGGQSVNSGKMMTRGTSLATDILEEFRALSFSQTYLVIEDAGAPTDTRFTWNSTTNAPNYPADASYIAKLTAWRTQAQQTLPKGEVTITVRGLQNLGSAGNPEPVEIAFANARVIQVVVSVRWQQGRRNRSVVFETFKS